MAKTWNGLANRIWTKTIHVQWKWWCAIQAPLGQETYFASSWECCPCQCFLMSSPGTSPEENCLDRGQVPSLWKPTPITGLGWYKDPVHLLQFKAALKGRAGFQAHHGLARLRLHPRLPSPSASWLFLLLLWQTLMLRNFPIGLLHAGFYLRVCSTGIWPTTLWQSGSPGTKVDSR